MHRLAIVVPAAPHYRDEQGQEYFWPGRVQRGIELALKYNCPLIFAGDANGGSDLDHSIDLAHKAGVRVTVRAFNGTQKNLKNTRGDARITSSMIRDLPELAHVEQLIVVTCWYHVPRAWIAYVQEIKVVNPERQINVYADAIWHRAAEGLRRLLSPTGELRGCLDYLRHRPQISRGWQADAGKPDFVKATSNRPDFQSV